MLLEKEVRFPKVLAHAVHADEQEVVNDYVAHLQTRIQLVHNLLQSQQIIARTEDYDGEI